MSKKVLLGNGLYEETYIDKDGKVHTRIRKEGTDDKEI